MSNIDTGDAAFPIVIPANQDWSEFDRGMTLRDWFAGMAMQGLLAADHDVQRSHEDIAGWAWTQADSMIVEKRRMEGGPE